MRRLVPSVRDDLERSRLTVGFRLLLALPHLVWIGIWGVGVTVVALPLWLVTLVKGVPPAGLHGFVAKYVRYNVHVYAYLYLAANPFPGFLGDRYLVDVELPPPERQNRWTVAFRLILAIPALLLALALAGSTMSNGNAYLAILLGSLGVTATAGFLAWFACLARGRMPAGMRDLLVYSLAYAAQAWSYALCLTGRYPNSDPLVVPLAPPPEHPVAAAIDDDGRRHRLIVGFRLLLALPHFVWLALWSVVVLVAAIVTWLATLVAGRPPARLHAFLSRFTRYSAHVSAFSYLTANPFPGFTGRPGSYPVDVRLPGPERQNRWVTGFRGLLAFPALLLGGALNGAASIAAVLGWFASLFCGRMPHGLRNLTALSVRYQAQLYAYALFLTDRYPYSGPIGPAVTGWNELAPERP